jgi:DNA-binding response OmpR family regulator
MRLVILDRDSGFRVVLAKRIGDLGWDYRTFARSIPPAKIVAMGLDAVVIDLGLLGRNAWTWLEELDAAPHRPAIVVCTAGASPHDRVRALRLCADDWLAKPCHPEELIARVEAVVRQRRRLAAAPVAPLIIDELEVRHAEYQAFINGTSLKLTLREFQVLEVLALQPGTTLARELIYELVWGGEMPREDRAVDVVVHKLRRKLLGQALHRRYIHTHSAVGYSFAPVTVEQDPPHDDGLRVPA